MTERWIARLSLILVLAMVGGMLGVWSASGSPAGEPLRATSDQHDGAAALAAPADAKCIDVDPETGTGPSYGEHQLNAVVTDGAKSTSGGDDSCSGAPVADVQVVWVIEDDTPDAWFSSQDSVPTTKTISGGNANPNSVTTQTKADGTTFVRVQLNDPMANGENRFGAHFGDDVPEPGSSTSCDVPVLGFPCPGEAANEDDVKFSWVTATPTPTASPTPTATPTATPTPTTPAKVERNLSMLAPDKVKSGGRATFSGRLTSAENECVSGQFVRIQRRAVGEEAFTEFDSTTTDDAGSYLVTRPVDFNADYRAVVGEGDACAEAMSAEHTVLAGAAVTASASPGKPRRGARFTISGSVRPVKEGTTVQLQRKQNGGWRLVRRAELGPDSVFRFRLRAKFGNATFRARWVSQDELNETGARRLTVKTRR
ncbi:MAG TPA: hypothetical protein VM784_05855 [Actinomycetota bacterium]|nr:hypothetical protein [Actinomycetota bacterium]